MLCGLGVPSLRSLWGAVRNRQLYILRMYCKGWISFNFSIFFIIYTTYSKKKKLHDLQQKKKIQFFFIIHTTYSKKKKITRIYNKKKIYTTIRFFCTRLTFFTGACSGMRPPAQPNPTPSFRPLHPGRIGGWNSDWTQVLAGANCLEGRGGRIDCHPKERGGGVMGLDGVG